MSAPNTESVFGAPLHPSQEEQGITELDARGLGRFRGYFARHPRVTRGLLLLLVTLNGVSALVISWPGLPLLGKGLLPGLLIICLAALLFLSSRPIVLTFIVVPAIALAILVGGVVNGIGSDLILAVVIYTVAANRSSIIAWASLIGSITVLSIASLWWAQGQGGPSMSATVILEGEGSTAPQMFGIIFLSIVGLSLGINTRSRRQHFSALVDRHQRIVHAREQDTLLSVAAEQARIAREMHDIVAHSLTVMISLSDGAQATLSRSPEVARSALEQLSSTGRSSLTDMRRILGVLRDTTVPLEPAPGDLDIDELVQSYHSAGLPVHLNRSGKAIPTDPGLQLAMYRIVQESLTNTLRHVQGAGDVEVSLASHQDHVVIEITDDGEVGSVPLVAGSGRGIIGMRERVAAYGGSLEAGPYGSGWRVVAQLPINGENQ